MGLCRCQTMRKEWPFWPKMRRGKMGSRGLMTLRELEKEGAFLPALMEVGRWLHNETLKQTQVR